MSLLNQTIKKILPPDQRAIKFVENKLAQTMTNADGLGELKNLLLRYVGIIGPVKFMVARPALLGALDQG